jgi:hypothetical protein
MRAWLLLDGITVRNYRSGKAFVLNGNDIRLVAPVVANAAVPDIGGIHYTGGTGFRCSDATVTTTGDAVRLAPVAAGGTITDAALTGMRLSAGTGMALVIETLFGPLNAVRVSGLVAEAKATYNVLRIRNANAGTITGITVRDAVLTSRAVVSEAVAVDALNIQNNGTAAGVSIADILLDNVTVAIAAGTGTEKVAPAAVRMTTAGDAVIEGVSWSGGGVRPTDAAGPMFPTRYMTLRKANRVWMGPLRLDGSTHPQPVLVGEVGPCRDVVFEDVVMTRVANGATGAVTFDKATHCGWVRGAITGSAGAIFQSVSFNVSSVGCYLEGVDLGGNAQAPDAKATVTTAAAYRLVDNFESTQRSAVGLGTPVTVGLTATGAIRAPSSFVALNPNGGTTLNTITFGPTGTTAERQSQPGDLLVLTTVPGQTATVNDATSTVGNIRLASAAGATGIVLGPGGRDTLTLMCRADDWIELAASRND